jgi:hypothetical protein
METSAQVRHTWSHVLYDSQISVAVKTRTVGFGVIIPRLAGINVSEEYTASVFRSELHNTVSRKLQHFIVN